MIPSRQGAVMAQLRRIFYCSINLAITLTAHVPPYCRHKIRDWRACDPRRRGAEENRDHNHQHDRQDETGESRRWGAVGTITFSRLFPRNISARRGATERVNSQ
jgi:hypothetical protein